MAGPMSSSLAPVSKSTSAEPDDNSIRWPRVMASPDWMLEPESTQRHSDNSPNRAMTGAASDERCDPAHQSPPKTLKATTAAAANAGAQRDLLRSMEESERNSVTVIFSPIAAGKAASTRAQARKSARSCGFSSISVSSVSTSLKLAWPLR